MEIPCNGGRRIGRLRRLLHHDYVGRSGHLPWLVVGSIFTADGNYAGGTPLLLISPILPDVACPETPATGDPPRLERRIMHRRIWAARHRRSFVSEQNPLGQKQGVSRCADCYHLIQVRSHLQSIAAHSQI